MLEIDGKHSKIRGKNNLQKGVVNGFRTEKLTIEQSVKQGDALSCSLFILCMDPLIRNILHGFLFHFVFFRKNIGKPRKR